MIIDSEFEKFMNFTSLIAIIGFILIIIDQIKRYRKKKEKYRLLEKYEID